MKNLFVIVLFLSIAIRPLCQLGTLGYYQLHLDTIVNKYCINKEKPKLQCNGKCYLSKQLLLQQEVTTPDQKGVTTITEAFFPVFFQETNINNTPPPFFGVIKTYWAIDSSYFMEFVYIIDPPPQHSYT